MDLSPPQFQHQQHHHCHHVCHCYRDGFIVMMFCCNKYRVKLGSLPDSKRVHAFSEMYVGAYVIITCLPWL